MIEFGSDFHKIDSFDGSGLELGQRYELLACGRQALLSLIAEQGWKRMWVPTYFCHEVILYLQRKSNIEIEFYNDYPGSDDVVSINDIPFADTDVLLRMNYFGLRSWRDNAQIPIPVIEDHSHDLVGDWAIRSNADWCIASLRKTLPIAEGGIVWSPRNLELPTAIHDGENERLSAERWKAMWLKRAYVSGYYQEKESFRSVFMKTESQFDSLPISAIDEQSNWTIQHFDLSKWTAVRRHNWSKLNKLLASLGVQVLVPENAKCNPFMVVFLFESFTRRNQVRQRMIENKIYPAILWSLPDCVKSDARCVSERILMIHCDGRYDSNACEELCNRLKQILS